jgi:molybdate transport system ATP-binding protein
MLEMNVTLRRGKFALATELFMRNANTGIFGASGAGKSTVLGLIAGTLQPQKGRIVLDGKTLFDSHKGIMMPREFRPVGAVLQNDRAEPRQKVKHGLHSLYDRIPRLRRALKLGDLIELMDLGKLLDRFTDELSAGESQRLALVRALLKSPRLLLLDEPFAPLGRGFRSQLQPLLRRVQSELGIPTLYASHSLGEILDLTDRLIVMKEGRVLGNGTLRQVIRDEDSARALGLRQVENVLPARVIDHQIEDGCTLATTFGIELALPLRPHLAPGSQVHVSVRPGDIALSRHYLAGISIQNQMKGRICAVVPAEGSLLVQVDCGTTLLAGITPRAFRDMALREGEEVYCLAKTQSFAYLGDAARTEFGEGDDSGLRASPAKSVWLDLALFPQRGDHHRELR